MNDNVSQELLILYLDYEFSQLNLYLTEEQLNSISKQLFTPNVNSITFSFTEEQLLNTKYSKEEDTVEDVLNILKNEEQQLEKFINLSDDERGEYSSLLAKRIAKERLFFIYKNTPDYFIELRAGNILVKESIDEIWGQALDLFELLINTAIDITTHFDVSKLENFNENIDLYDALQRLQGRACLLTNEILVLLRAGFTDGAYARCRTLYETMVISCFICDNGNETARRYLDYSIVNELNEAKLFTKYNEIFENDINNEEIEELEKEVDKLKQQYEIEFINGDYNWALNIIQPKNKKKIQFWEIEAKVDFKNMKQFYKSSSNNIHTASSSLYFHRGLNSDKSHNILMGASDLGIEVPCELASYFINITTSNLMLYKAETTEHLIQISLLNLLREDLQKYLDEIEAEIYK
ncbi:DUF5677 domain-containing protein [Aliarcobacter cryaerophilus]|uniref:DUF5677 domain-containing protein n=1 Tax=Aliarcobacter cryaerophilus TaxID=28198 RepID=UPI0013DE6260|nr:DUF5677 domain-containing protein [Aliarcobacter cryaerophilus]